MRMRPWYLPHQPSCPWTGPLRGRTCETGASVVATKTWILSTSRRRRWRHRHPWRHWRQVRLRSWSTGMPMAMLLSMVTSITWRRSMSALTTRNSGKLPIRTLFLPGMLPSGAETRRRWRRRISWWSSKAISRSWRLTSRWRETRRTSSEIKSFQLQLVRSLSLVILSDGCDLLVDSLFVKYGNRVGISLVAQWSSLCLYFWIWCKIIFAINSSVIVANFLLRQLVEQFFLLKYVTTNIPFFWIMSVSLFFYTLFGHWGPHECIL